MSADVRVVVVDDDPLVRSGLELLLSGADGIMVAGTAADGDEVPAVVAASRPDVVLMDLRMRRVDGITATERLAAVDGAPAVLVLTTFDGDDEVLGALGAGADGFLLKDAPPEELVAAIRAAATGEVTLAPSVARRLVDRTATDAARRDRAREALSQLSDREREVAAAIAHGLSNAAVARQLHMSVATVKAHVSHIFTKLDLDNRTQLALLTHDAERP